MKIISIVGARPNFMKIAPIQRALRSVSNIEAKIVHTGQHYDANMSQIFFDELEMPRPDFYLGIGGGTHTYQTANIMLAFEKIVQEERPDLVLVVGDVNSTLACSLVAVKNGIPIVHVEAGLRSRDRTMPEEINRVLTDSISDYLFVTEESGMENLKQENVADSKVHFVGNVMIDSVKYMLTKTVDYSIEELLKGTGVNAENIPNEGDYALVTMHRPTNVDNLTGLKSIVSIVKAIAERKTVLFPLHPRTKNNLDKEGLLQDLVTTSSIIMMPPIGYLQFIYLMKNALAVITDSGGIQEETTYLGVPCLTLRSSTERPITVTIGSNTLVPELDVEMVMEHFNSICSNNYKNSKIPELWDGHAAERIVDIIQTDWM